VAGAAKILTVAYRAFNPNCRAEEELRRSWQGCFSRSSAVYMPAMRHFTRTEPERRLHRFYVVDVVPDLFGRTCLWLEWGRSGQPGTLRRQVYADPRDAETAAARVIRRRLQRGYFENLVRSP
jgi:predicted DNA-binding WGR domain protein